LRQRLDPCLDAVDIECGDLHAARPRRWGGYRVKALSIPQVRRSCKPAKAALGRFRIHVKHELTIFMN